MSGFAISQPCGAEAAESFSKRLAELLGGQISPDGTPGEDATFTFQVPHRRPEP